MAEEKKTGQSGVQAFVERAGAIEATHQEQIKALVGPELDRRFMANLATSEELAGRPLARLPEDLNAARDLLKTENGLLYLGNLRIKRIATPRFSGDVLDMPGALGLPGWSEMLNMALVAYSGRVAQQDKITGMKVRAVSAPILHLTHEGYMVTLFLWGYVGLEEAGK